MAKGRVGARIFEFGILAMALAVYRLFLEDMFLASWGRDVGFGEIAVGYFCTAIIGFGIAWAVMQSLKREARKESEEGP